MNPRQPLACPPNESGESMPYAQVWSTLSPHQRATIKQALLLVCCQLASLSQRTVVNEGPMSPAARSMEVAHERA
jgi:hypothetical protein